MKLFVGPGHHLAIPDMLGLRNPNCKAEVKTEYRKGGWSRTRQVVECTCLGFIRFMVPFGHWYRTEPHIEIVRPATLEEIKSAVASQAKEETND